MGLLFHRGLIEQDTIPHCVSDEWLTQITVGHACKRVAQWYRITGASSAAAWASYLHLLKQMGFPTPHPLTPTPFCFKKQEVHSHKLCPPPPAFKGHPLFAPWIAPCLHTVYRSMWCKNTFQRRVKPSMLAPTVPVSKKTSVDLFTLKTCMTLCLETQVINHGNLTDSMVCGFDLKHIYTQHPLFLKYFSSIQTVVWLLNVCNWCSPTGTRDQESERDPLCWGLLLESHRAQWKTQNGYKEMQDNPKCLSTVTIDFTPMVWWSLCRFFCFILFHFKMYIFTSRVTR